MKYAALVSTPLVLSMASQLMACHRGTDTDGGMDTDTNADTDVTTDPDTDADPDMDTDPEVASTTTEHTLSVGGAERNYLLTVPSTYSDDEDVPLLFNVHGLQSNAQQQLAISGFEALAEQEGFLLVTPSAVGGVWTVTGFPFNNGSDDLGFIEALVDELSDTYSVDPDRIYATGMSQGGFLAFDVACGADSPFAAIAPVSGVMTPDMAVGCTPSRPVPVLQTHGTADPQIDYSGADTVIAWWVDFNGAAALPEVAALPDPHPDNGTTIDRLVFSGGEDGVDVEHLRINGGGHVWPGADGDSDVDIAEEIWSFLSRYDVNGRIEE